MAFQGPGSYKISKGFRGEKRYLTTKGDGSLRLTNGPFEEGISWSIHPLKGAEIDVYQIIASSLGPFPVIGQLEPVFDTDGTQPHSGTARVNIDSDAAEVGWSIVEAESGFSISVRVPPSPNATLPRTLYLVEEAGVISLKTQDTGPVHWNFEARDPKKETFQGEGTYKISKGFRGEKFYLTTQNDGSLVRTGSFEEAISWSLDPLVGAEEGVYQITASRVGSQQVIGFLEPVFAANGIQPASGAMRVNTDAEAPKVGWYVDEAEVGFSISAAFLSDAFPNVTLLATLYLVEEAGTILWKTKEDIEPVQWNFEAININRMTFRGAGTYYISKGFRGEKFYLTTQNDGSLVRSSFRDENGAIAVCQWTVEPLKGFKRGPYYITASSLGSLNVTGTLEPVFVDDEGVQSDSGSVRANPSSSDFTTGEWSVLKAEVGFSVVIRRFSAQVIGVDPPKPIYLVEDDGNIGWKTQDQELVHWNFEPVRPSGEEPKAEDV